MNVLIYFLDELRADVLGCYGHPFVRTPAMDAIAASGMRFDAAYSNCPLCMPARVSFFTGRYPSEHGVLFNGNVKEVQHGYQGDPELFAFGAMLREAGFGRIVNVGKHHTGFSPEISGFTEHVPAPDGRKAKPFAVPEGTTPDAHVVKIPGIPPNTIIAGAYPGDGADSHPAVVADRAIETLNGLTGSDDPWLLRVSMNSPHTPVMPPAPYDRMYEADNASWEPDAGEIERRTPLLARVNDVRGYNDISLVDQRWARTCYHGLTTFVDAQIGRVQEEVARLGLEDNLLTIVISDHGSSIGDHGQQVKGPFDTDDIARIPLILSGPGVGRGSYRPLVQIIDVLPTLASLVGRGKWREEAEKTSGVAPGGNGLYSGRSLADVLGGRIEPVHDAVFSEGEFARYHPGARQSVRTGQWLYTRYPEVDEHELFNLQTDSQQTTNVSASNRIVVAELSKRIDAWQRSHGSRVPISMSSQESL